MENGHEVVVPPILSQKRLPQSYRYYDPIVQIVRLMVSKQKTKLMGLQHSLSHQYFKKHTDMKSFAVENLLFGSKSKGKREKLSESQSKNPFATIQKNIDYETSMQTKQLQRSEYV